VTFDVGRGSPARDFTGPSLLLPGYHRTVGENEVGNCPGVSYVDNIILQDDAETVLKYFLQLEVVILHIGLEMNRDKGEVIG